MLTEERQAIILKLLKKSGIVKLQDLVTQLCASESTVRRDLKELEESGLLRRVHGGARQIQQLDYEQNMAEKSAKNVQEKQLIAAAAADMVQHKDIIYLDAGSTTYEMIPFLKDKSATVITNSVTHASSLIDLGIPTIVIGGLIKSSTKAILGTVGIKQLSYLQCNHAFLGMNGIHPRYGFTTPDPEEAAMKATAIAQSENCIVLADHSKFGKISFAKVAELESGCIITDYCSPDMRSILSKKTDIKEVTSNDIHGHA